MSANISMHPDREHHARSEYELGIVFSRKKYWRAAARHFAAAEYACRRDDIQVHRYRSWHGLALVYSGDVSGLNLCRNAAENEIADGTVFRNLVLAELKFHHRKRACVMLARGLSVAPGHRGLLRLRRVMGVRRPPCLDFLGRNNPINKWLGKITYRRR